MAKRSKPTFLVVILGIILVIAIFFQARPLGSSDRVANGAKDGFKNKSRIFVKGNHAYVIRSTGPPTDFPAGYLLIFNVGAWRGETDTTTLIFTNPCHTETIPKASDIFISGDYLYVAGLKDAATCSLKRYDISTPCSPEFVNSVGVGEYLDSTQDPTMPWVGLTDMYITRDSAFLSIDAWTVLVFDVSGPDTLKFLDKISSDHSPQGVQVRGKYMYVANEGGGLWVRDIVDSTDYHTNPPPEYSSRDVYNVVCNGKSRTYEITASHGFYIWNTDAPAESIPMVGSSGELGEIVHITGNWVYWLDPPGPVKVCSLVCDANPQWKADYGTDLHDFHVLHDSGGHAHIYGIKLHPDTTIKDSVQIWYRKTLHNAGRIPFRYGDVDGDGDGDSADSSRLYSYVVQGNTVPVNLDACDVNCDGEVNTDDYEYLSNYLSHHGTPEGPPPGADCGFYHYVYGDANADRTVNSADVAYLINYLYLGEVPPPNPMAAGDPNGDCVVTSADVTYLINYLFVAGPAPRRGCAE
jgi:hypothetical protein